MAEETQNTPPQFSAEQQAFINTIIDQRIGKTKEKAEKDTAAAIAAAVADKDAEIARLQEIAKKGGGADTEAERAQMKALLDAEKARTNAALELAKKNDDLAKGFESQNRNTLKSVAIREAADAQEGFTFVDYAVVRQLIDGNVHWDADSNSFIVKGQDGIVRQNASLQSMSLKEYLAEFAAQHPYLVKGITKGGSGSGESGRSGSSGFSKVTTKADLKTVKEKSDYITKFGGDAYNKLPLK